MQDKTLLPVPKHSTRTWSRPNHTYRNALAWLSPLSTGCCALAHFFGCIQFWWQYYLKHLIFRWSSLVIRNKGRINLIRTAPPLPVSFSQTPSPHNLTSQLFVFLISITILDPDNIHLPKFLLIMLFSCKIVILWIPSIAGDKVEITEIIKFSYLVHNSVV